MKNRNYISVFYYFFIYYIAATIANTASVASTVKAGIHSVMDGHSLTSGINLFGRYF